VVDKTELYAVKGMNDIGPFASEPFLHSAVWQHILGTAGTLLNQYGFAPVHLPVVEPTALFSRGIGAETDIVGKEMYTFTDRGDRSLSLRPEGTAGAVRAYLEHNLARTDPVQKWWYAGPMFRAERPQKGRYRQFYQIGAEVLGIADPSADAEMLSMLHHLCTALGLDGIAVRLNTLGDRESRQAYRGVLVEYLTARQGELCESCRGRIQTNPFRVLDCKRETCHAVAVNAPDILLSLTPASREHFDRVCALLGDLKVPYVRDPLLVRGLDYYTGTTFEFTTGLLGSQDAILGGGRYDELVELLGGPPTPAIGFAAGVERLALLIADKVAKTGPDLYLIPMPGAQSACLLLAGELRKIAPWRVEVDCSGGRVKHQMHRADRIRARSAIVIGSEELASGRGKLKNLKDSTDVPVELCGPAVHAALLDCLGS